MKANKTALKIVIRVLNKRIKQLHANGFKNLHLRGRFFKSGELICCIDEGATCRTVRQIRNCIRNHGTDTMYVGLIDVVCGRILYRKIAGGLVKG